MLTSFTLECSGSAGGGGCLLHSPWNVLGQQGDGGGRGGVVDFISVTLNWGSGGLFMLTQGNLTPWNALSQQKRAKIPGMVGRRGGRGRVVYFIRVKPDTLECAWSAKKCRRGVLVAALLTHTQLQIFDGIPILTFVLFVL